MQAGSGQTIEDSLGISRRPPLRDAGLSNLTNLAGPPRSAGSANAHAHTLLEPSGNLGQALGFRLELECILVRLGDVGRSAQRVALQTNRDGPQDRQLCLEYL